MKVFFSCFTASWREDWLGLLVDLSHPFGSLSRNVFVHFERLLTIAARWNNDEEKENDDLSRVSFLKRFAIKSNTSCSVGWKVKGIMIEFRSCNFILSRNLLSVALVLYHLRSHELKFIQRMSDDKLLFSAIELLTFSVQWWNIGR